MKSIRGAVGLAALVVLSGCASGEHLYMAGECVTCVTNPITGEPLNYDPDATPEELRGQTIGESIHGNNMAGDFEMGSSLDVDTAYARIKSEFGFRSPQDFDANDRFRKMRMSNSAWHHEAVPGSYYKLKDSTTGVLYGQRVHYILQAEILKNGNGSTVRFHYAPTGGHYDGTRLARLLREKASGILQ